MAPSSIPSVVDDFPAGALIFFLGGGDLLRRLCGDRLLKLPSDNVGLILFKFQMEQHEKYLADIRISDRLTAI